MNSLYLSGELIDASNYLSVTNPFTNQEIQKVSVADANIVEQAINNASESFNETKQLSGHEKSIILKTIAEKIQNRNSELSELISLESGKPIKYAKAEVQRAIQTFLIASEECKRIPYEYYSLSGNPDGKNKEALVKRFPIGVVLAITPFNFPLNLVAHKVAPAIAAGCPIILKPASSTPLTALALAKIIQETTFPKKAFSVLPCKSSIIEQFLAHQKIAKISFTGSPIVGWKIKQLAYNKKVTLELGGNAATIITDSINIDNIIAHCVTSGFAYSGQVCIHTQRFYIHRLVFDEFVKKFITATQKLQYGNPINDTTDISVMIDEENAKRVETWVQEAIQHGAEYLLKGKKINNHHEPVILTNTNTSMKVNSEEIFGPVVCVEKYNGDIKQAVALVNDTNYGLQCGVFTNKIDELNYCFENIQTGGVIHNGCSIVRLDEMPYGGIKDSGYGKEGVRYAIMEMTEPKLLVKQN